jgi:hypothetical protein
VAVRRASRHGHSHGLIDPTITRSRAILRITWQSWQTVRTSDGHEHDHD